MPLKWEALDGYLRSHTFANPLNAWKFFGVFGASTLVVTLTFLILFHVIFVFCKKKTTTKTTKPITVMKTPGTTSSTPMSATVVPATAIPASRLLTAKQIEDEMVQAEMEAALKAKAAREEVEAKKAYDAEMEAVRKAQERRKGEEANKDKVSPAIMPKSLIAKYAATSPANSKKFAATSPAATKFDENKKASDSKKSKKHTSKGKKSQKESAKENESRTKLKKKIVEKNVEPKVEAKPAKAAIDDSKKTNKEKEKKLLTTMDEPTVNALVKQPPVPIAKTAPTPMTKDSTKPTASKTQSKTQPVGPPILPIAIVKKPVIVKQTTTQVTVKQAVVPNIAAGKASLPTISGGEAPPPADGVTVMGPVAQSMYVPGANEISPDINKLSIPKKK